MIAAGFVIGCGDREATQKEARSFMRAYEAVSHKAPVPKRRAALDALRGLILHRPEVKEARDRCVRAHEALLEGEAAQEQAAQALDRALAAAPAGGAPLAPATRADIGAELERSEKSLADAKAKFADCEDSYRDLQLRYDR